MTQAKEISQMLLPVLHGQFVEVDSSKCRGRMYSEYLFEAMRPRPPALEPWKNRKHVRIRQQANDMVASGKMKPKGCEWSKGCSVGPAKTHKHHVTYDRPDNVKWYCGPHHDQTHADIEKMPVESCSAKCNTCGRESCRCIANSNTNQSQQIMSDLGEASGSFAWFVEYILPNGKKTRKSTTGEKKAKALKKSLEADQFQGVKIIKEPIPAFQGFK